MKILKKVIASSRELRVRSHELNQIRFYVEHNNISAKLFHRFSIHHIWPYIVHVLYDAQNSYTEILLYRSIIFALFLKNSRSENVVQMWDRF